ncbi:MAG: DUF2306 domain-containing protein [Rubrobacteraceae bacterium]
MVSSKRATGKRWGWWAAWGTIVVLSVGISLLAFPRYLPFVSGEAQIPLNPGFPDSHAFVIALHAIPGGLALLIGPFQFLASLRRRYPAAHRLAGRVYLVCVAAGGVAGLFAGVMAVTGSAAQVGFILLAVLWLYSGFKAYTSIRRGNVQLHRIWMIRNFALTFAAVLLRGFLVAGTALTPLAFDELYTISAWSSFSVSLVFAEWFIVQRTLGPLTQRQPQR